MRIALQERIVRMMPEGILALVTTSLVFVFAAFAFKWVPYDYVKFHEENPFMSYNGFNIAFIKFTEQSLRYTKKLGFKVFLIAGLVHIVLCVLCFVIFPMWNRNSIACSSVILLALSALVYVIIKIDRFEDRN